ncbi:VC0807 family protein [Streptomyces sp. NPDC052109]|uniref:VC0807 family protein n=1 Tax=Streptomyces sp. NPDC052109 TaxID=3155527 RepID=UPI00343E2A4C
MPKISSDPTAATDNRSAGARSHPAARGMASMLFYDIGLSVIAYFVAELLGAGSYVALLAGTVASGLRVCWVAARQRRVDPFAVFLLALFGAGLALSFTTGDPRFILAKDAAMSTTAGLVLVVSCIIGRPLAYYAALRFAHSAGGAQHEEFRSTAKSTALQARWFRVSLVWGVSLLVDASLRIAAVYLLPIGLAANVSQVLMVAVYTLLFVWTLVSARKTEATARAQAQV